jgi:hypothetical protein
MFDLGELVVSHGRDTLVFGILSIEMMDIVVEGSCKMERRSDSNDCLTLS